MDLPSEILDIYILAIFGSVLLVFLALKCYIYLKDSRRARMPFIVGQVWNYHTRKNEPFSSLTIVKIDRFGRDIVVHINVKGLKIKPDSTKDGSIYEISHIPMTPEALAASVTSVACEAEVLPDYEPAYNKWRRLLEMPVYDIPVHGIIQGIEAALQAEVDSGIKTSDEEDE